VPRSTERLQRRANTVKVGVERIAAKTMVTLQKAIDFQAEPSFGTPHGFPSRCRTRSRSGWGSFGRLAGGCDAAGLGQPPSRACIKNAGRRSRARSGFDDSRIVKAIPESARPQARINLLVRDASVG
jgi:hypothetical protein